MTKLLIQQNVLYVQIISLESYKLTPKRSPLRNSTHSGVKIDHSYFQDSDIVQTAGTHSYTSSNSNHIGTSSTECCVASKGYSSIDTNGDSCSLSNRLVTAGHSCTCRGNYQYSKCCKCSCGEWRHHHKQNVKGHANNYQQGTTFFGFLEFLEETHHES